MLTPPCPNEAHECQTSDIFPKTLQTRRAVQTGNRSHYKLGFQTVVTVLQVQPGCRVAVGGERIGPPDGDHPCRSPRPGISG